MNTPSSSFDLEPVDFTALPGWGDDDPSSLFRVMGDCLSYLKKAKPYRAGSLGLTAADLIPLLEAAEGEAPKTNQDARRFFENHCQPFRIRRKDGEAGFVTAFYEPEVEVAAEPDEVFRFPFYRRPEDLIDLDDSNRPAGLDSGYMFGRRVDGRVEAYPDRQAIDQGFLEGRGLEIAWAKSKVDVFFIHVQGAARLIYRDGTVRRITYAAKAGHAFSGIGKLLLERLEIPLERMSMQAIREWLARHPEQVDEVLWHNRSYIFFREAEVGDLSRGPVAAAKVPLLAGRSLAVDRLIHTFGFPFYIHSQSLTRLDQGASFARLMLALDTGSAIVGPARGDIFTGSGFEAGELAGAVRNAADFYILIPRQAAARFG
ncbi:murein transglycosylase A [Rhizobium paknamense]|uniref:peptidoglycan lytic exotransglycosylase n=1 Tax=Rhizobium paknamense TaxID=1206817 RepID=A0ABU0II69_9HYPH|nr:murein transglycosylase A [Rhizobium paknamense]MDQ0457954.1 membrane-bound lytic murein transglycosylase A [Rhizobium paknamense]